jgi:hypothetical protein
MHYFSGLFLEPVEPSKVLRVPFWNFLKTALFLTQIKDFDIPSPWHSSQNPSTSFQAKKVCNFIISSKDSIWGKIPDKSYMLGSSVCFAFVDKN